MLQILNGQKVFSGSQATFKTCTPIKLNGLPIGNSLLITSIKDTICTSEISHKHIEVKNDVVMNACSMGFNVIVSQVQFDISAVQTQNGAKLWNSKCIKFFKEIDGAKVKQILLIQILNATSIVF